MAWQVYGFDEPGFRGTGPLPRKRWVKSPDDKPHKMSKRYGKMPALSLDADGKRRIDERRARDYAIWLARRDGIKLPDTFQLEYEWTGFYSKHKKTRRKFWDGVREVKVYCERIKSVHWRISSSRVITVELPNWDFDPCEPVEEIVQEMLAA